MDEKESGHCFHQVLRQKRSEEIQLKASKFTFACFDAFKLSIENRHSLLHLGLEVSVESINRF